MNQSSATSLIFRESEVVANGVIIDPFSPTAVSQLCQALGPELGSMEAGVKGIGRTAHWLASGVLLVSQDVDGDLMTIDACFDADDSSPFPDKMPVVTPFEGSVEWAGHSFVGGESEDSIRSIPGVEGLGGLLDFRNPNTLEIGVRTFSVEFELRKPRDRFGKRSGARRLVRIGASWRGVQPFRYPPKKLRT